MEGKEHDLSEYELQRLQNIQRNEAMLKALGFQPLINNQLGGKKESSKEKEVRVIKRKRKEEIKDSPKELLLPTRKSPRLHAQLEGEKEKLESSSASGTEGEDEIDYDRMPFEPNELNDAEFQIYVELKKWRLRRCRELDTEPYKVFQNRTLCEFVRRKRNDKDWAKPVDLTNTTTDKERLISDLLLCWGVGARKVSDDGFAFELNSVFHNLDDSLLSQLHQMRDTNQL